MYCLRVLPVPKSIFGVVPNYRMGDFYVSTARFVIGPCKSVKSAFQRCSILIVAMPFILTSARHRALRLGVSEGAGLAHILDGAGGLP